MGNFTEKIKSLLLFQEPKPVEQFILREKGQGKAAGEMTEESGQQETKRKKTRKGVVFPKSSTETTASGEKKKDERKSEISADLKENLDYMGKVYNLPINSDVVVREFDIVVKEKSIPAFIIFIDGMVDRKVVSSYIIQPLMLLSGLDIKIQSQDDVAEYVRKHLLTYMQVKETGKFQKVIETVNFGGCAIFVHSINLAFLADVKGWEHRGVDRPSMEMVLRGPQEAFTEVLRINTALVRKIVRDENLVIENITVGKRSKTPCSLLYIRNIANDELVNEARRRLKGIKVDYIVDSGELEQLLEESYLLPAPQIIATERPDRVASLLSDGRVGILMDGSPFALMVPSTIVNLINSPEDNYVRYPYVNFLRGLRILGIGLSLLLPGLYVAITNYHQEMIPTDLLFAIEAARERVPFPSVMEILIMEVSFELIREAGIRIPGPIGPTLGIIGALILGQAAVAANIVSPILIIIVAVTGIGSFTVPDYSMNFSIRILRFGYIILGAIAGFLGISTGIFIHGLILTGAKSFGVPIVASFTPRTKGGFIDALQRCPLWRQEFRPDYLSTKEPYKQPHISRQWEIEAPAEGEQDEQD